MGLRGATKENRSCHRRKRGHVGNLLVPWQRPGKESHVEEASYCFKSSEKQGLKTRTSRSFNPAAEPGFPCSWCVSVCLFVN